LFSFEMSVFDNSFWRVVDDFVWHLVIGSRPRAGGVF
jgi:hypothetical protein